MPEESLIFPSLLTVVDTVIVPSSLTGVDTVIVPSSDLMCQPGVLVTCKKIYYMFICMLEPLGGSLLP